jgi:hypothetical protein
MWHKVRGTAAGESDAVFKKFSRTADVSSASRTRDHSVSCLRAHFSAIYELPPVLLTNHLGFASHPVAHYATFLANHLRFE